ncbi:type I secretion system permease/ATPase [Agarivorans sp. DSG3-1]|uniref:type I secretion system permease/ATPase n=1 Tax=Agarivorans sp. DSG3-1 TaxID=3342249 RepID=UPI00398F5321
MEQQDAWLDSIEWMCRHFGQSFNRLTLLRGLPLENGQLNADLFARACQQTGLKAVPVKLEQTQKFSGVLVALDKQQQLRMVTEIDQQMVNYQFSNKNAVCQQTLKNFKAEVSQQLWLISPTVTKDARVEQLHDTKQQHWITQALNEVKPWFRDLLLASVFINLLAMVVPLFTMNVYDRVVPNQAFNTLWTLAIGVSVALLFDWLLRKARSNITDMAGKQIDNKLSASIMQKVLGMSLENKPQSVGAFSRQIQDFDSVREFFTSITLVTLVDLPFTLFFLVLIAWLGGPMVFVPLSVLIGLLSFSLLMKAKIAASMEQSAKLSTQRQAELFETLSSLTEVKQFNAEGASQRTWEQTTSQMSDWQIRSRHLSNLVSHSIVTSQQVVTIGLVVIGVYRISEGLLSMGGLIAIVMLSGRAAGAINQLSMLILRYQQCRSAIQGLEQVMELPQEHKPEQIIQPGSFKGKLVFDKVSLCYPEQNFNALSNIELQVMPGERLGIIGSAGSGKSSLISLMAGQYSPTSGQILYQDIDSSMWPSTVLRQQIGWLGQDAHLVFGSVIQNILLGESELDEQKLASAISQSGLQTHLERLSNGLESQVGERGMLLSGGQRQAVALARALYRQPKLLLLDEPVSSLDNNNQSLIKQSLSKLPRDMTMVISSHQQSLLSICDRIIVLERGHLVANDKASVVLGLQSKKRHSVSVVREAKHD